MPSLLQPTKGGKSRLRCAFRSLGSLGKGALVLSVSGSQPVAALLCPGPLWNWRSIYKGRSVASPVPSVLCSALVWTKPTSAWRQPLSGWWLLGEGGRVWI